MQDDTKARFSALSDDEMLDLGAQYPSLTFEAQAIVRDEFQRRSLDIPMVDSESAANALSKVVTIRQYRDQADASMARSVLQSAQIPCFLRDENTIRIDWLWSNLMGGIRLQVAEEDVAAAEAILSQPIPASIKVDGQEDYQQPECPRCNSLDISFNNFDAKVGAASLLFLGFPLPSPVDKDYWHCHDCGANWIDEPEKLDSGPA